MDIIGPTKKQLGERSQAHIIAQLLEVGYTVLTPYGDSSRYDLVIENGEGQFWRVQCKTAWIENGDTSIQFATTSLRTRSTNPTLLVSPRTKGFDLIGLDEPEDEILEEPEQHLSMHAR